MKKIMPPEAAAKAGMTSLVFYDDFDSLSTIDTQATGNVGYKWYSDQPYGRKPLEIGVDYDWEESILTVKQRAERKGTGIASYSKKGKTGFTFHFGYAEIRAKFKAADIPPIGAGQRAYWPCFWGHSYTDCMGMPWKDAGELDIFEAVHHKPVNKIMHTGATHHTRIFPDGTRLLGSNCVNGTGYRDHFDYIDDDWHVFAALWDYGKIEWYLDGKKMHATTYSENELPQYFYKNSDIPLPRIEEERPELADKTFKGCHSVMNDEDLILFIGGDEKWPFYVDWVRVWQRP